MPGPVNSHGKSFVHLDWTKIGGAEIEESVSCNLPLAPQKILKTYQARIAYQQPRMSSRKSLSMSKSLFVQENRLNSSIKLVSNKKNKM